MRVRLIAILFFLNASSSFIVNAQQQIFKNYTVNDGLVSNSIRKIYQDKKGFLWIGTMEGLSKYDGNTFTNYTTSNGLSHNLVNDFIESSDGGIFISFNNGTIDKIEDDKIIIKEGDRIVVNQFLKTPWHTVIAVTDSNGIYNFRDGKLTKPHQVHQRATFLHAVLLSGSTFVATDNSFLRLFNKKMEMLSEIKISENIYTEPRSYKDSKGRLWVASSSGIRIFNFIYDAHPHLYDVVLPAAFKFLSQYSIYDIYEDQKESLWFATSTGIVKIDPDGSHEIFTVKDGLPSNNVTTIFQDKEKTLWFGTSVGISKLVTRSATKLYSIENGVYQNDNAFLMYTFKKDHLLVGTTQGAKVFNKKSGVYSQAFKTNDDIFYSKVSNSNPVILTGANKSITFDTVTMKSNIILPLSAPSGVRIMICDKNGNGFAGNVHGLFFYSGNGLYKIVGDRISSLLISREGYLWAGTWANGLIRFQYKVTNKKIKILETRHFLAQVNIRCLLEDSQARIWAGSRYQGVFRLTKENSNTYKVLNFNQSKGLTSNYIKSIKEDRIGNIWIAFFQGLDKLVIKNNNIRIFNFSKVTNFFTSIIGLEADDDHLLWLATSEGIVKVKDDELEKLPASPVYITKVFSTDTTYPLYSGKLIFDYSPKELQFEFSSPSYINEKQITYSYKLTGNNEPSWSVPNHNHTVSYAGLQPGKYQFQVRSLGWNREWGTPAMIDFEITPPFWKTWWFTVSAITLSILFISWLVRRRIKVVRHESELKRRIVETEMMALRAQMNPHFIFNCINSIDALIQDNDKYHATIYLNKFAKLIRNILDSSKQETVSLADDLDTLKLYIELEQFRYEDKFIAEIEVDNAVLQEDYKIPPLIVQPFVENAIQHGLRDRPGKDGKLNIRISKYLNDLHYIIEDNGVGRKIKINGHQKAKTSYGISMSSERVRLFNKEEIASVKIEDLINKNQPSGTRVVVRLNIQSC